MKNQKPIQTSILIIGAGPGGAVTALALAQKGIPCIVVDKSSFPRDKVGGDVFPGIIMRALHEIDPQYVEILARQSFLWEIKGTRLFAPKGHSLQIDYRNINIGNYKNTTSCYAGQRSSLDQFLYEELKKQPTIQLLEAQSIDDYQYESDGMVLFDRQRKFEIKAKLVVLACGAQAPIVRKITGHLQTAAHKGVGLRAYFKNVHFMDEGRHAELHFIDGLLPGIFYLTPLPGGITNVNIGTREDVLHKKELKLKDILTHTIQQHPQLKERFKDAEMIGGIKGWSLPFATQKRPLYGDRYLLVGDAGSLIDFTSGNGIGSAMYSGLFAAQKIEACLKQQAFDAEYLADYQQAVEQKMAKHLKMGRMIAPFFGLTRLHGLYRALINQVIKRAANSELFSELMYNRNIEKELKSLSFYWKMLSGKKKPSRESS